MKIYVGRWSHQVCDSIEWDERSPIKCIYVNMCVVRVYIMGVDWTDKIF